MPSRRGPEAGWGSQAASPGSARIGARPWSSHRRRVANIGGGLTEGSLEVVEGELAERNVPRAATLHLATVEGHGQPLERLWQQHLGVVVARLPGAPRDRSREPLVAQAHDEVTAEARVGRAADLGLQRAGEQAPSFVDTDSAGER